MVIYKVSISSVIIIIVKYHLYFVMIVFQAGKDICKSTIRKKPVQSQENSVISIDYEHMFAFWTRKIIEICSTLTIKTSMRPLVN